MVNKRTKRVLKKYAPIGKVGGEPLIFPNYSGIGEHLQKHDIDINAGDIILASEPISNLGNIRFKDLAGNQDAFINYLTGIGGSIGGDQWTVDGDLVVNSIFPDDLINSTLGTLANPYPKAFIKDLKVENFTGYSPIRCDEELNMDNNDLNKVRVVKGENEIDVVPSGGTWPTSPALRISISSGKVYMTGLNTNTIILDDDIDLLSGDLTTTGTIQAEQITSTDDMDMAGEFTNVMGASDTSGLMIDGNTNQYTAAGDATAMTLQRTASRNVTANGSLSAFSNTISDISNLTQPAGFLTYRTNGISSTVTKSGTHTAGTMALTETTRGITANVLNSGNFQTGNATVLVDGMKLTAQNGGTYNKAGKTFSITTTGMELIASNAITTTAGTANNEVIGLKINAFVNGGTTNTGTGIRIIQAITRGIHDSSGGDWWMAQDNMSLNIGATETDLQISSDGTNGIIDVNTSLRIGNITTNYTEISSTGDLTFVGSAGLPYGSFYGNEFAQSQVMTTNTEYQVTHASIADSTAAHNITSDGNGKFTITKAGRYNIQWAVTAEHSATGKHILWGIAVDQALRNEGQQHRETKATSQEYQISGNTIINMAVGEDIEIGFKSADGTPGTAEIDHMNLSVIQIGG